MILKPVELCYGIASHSQLMAKANHACTSIIRDIQMAVEGVAEQEMRYVLGWS